MRDKPTGCYDSGCPLAVTCRNCGHQLSEHAPAGEGGKEPCHAEKCVCSDFASLGRGFVLGAGDPLAARFMAILEAPGSEEVPFPVISVSGRYFFGTKEEVEREIAVRKRDYPDLPERFIRTGAPAVGRTGSLLEFWAWPKVGLKRTDFFLDNTLRCLPPKKATGAYPTGVVRKAAEKACRQWDRLHLFRPDTFVFSLHPAGIMREITPLPLQIKDFEKVRDFAAAGRKVVALLGGKAVKAFARFGENVTKWRGHYVLLPRTWTLDYKRLFEFQAKERKKKEPKAPKVKKEKTEKVAKVKRAPSEKKARKARLKKFDDVFEL